MTIRATIQGKLVRTSLSVLVPAFLAVTLAVVALDVLLGAGQQRESESRIRASLVAKGRLLSRNNALAVRAMAEGNAFFQIRDLVASAVRDDPDVVYGMFLSSDSSDPSELADASDPGAREGMLVGTSEVSGAALASWARAAKAPKDRLDGLGPRQTLDFVVPVGEKERPAGWILYRLSTRSMVDAIAQERRKANLDLLVVVGILLAFGAGALLYSLSRFRTAARSISRPVRELAAAAEIIRGGDYKRPLRLESDDEIGELAQTFETMRQTVQNYTEHLEDLVAEKMRQVRDILDNVEQGLFVVNFDGSLSPEYSKAAPSILGSPRFDTLEDALHLSSSQRADFLAWLDLVRRRQSAMRWNKLVRLAPVQDMDLVCADGGTRYVRLHYQRMFGKDRQIERVMVLAQDETESRRIEGIVAQEKERHEDEVRTILGLVNNLPEVVRDFMRDTRRRIDDVQNACRSMLDRSTAARERHPRGPFFRPSSDDVSRIFRDYHTIKGNASTYGFDRLSRLAHRGEDILGNLREPATVRTAGTLRSLLDNLDEMDRAYDEIVSIEKKLSGGGSDGEAQVLVSERKIEHLRRLAETIHSVSRSSSDSDVEVVRTLAEVCRHVRDVSLSKLAEKYRGLSERLSERLGKRVRFDVDPPQLEVGPGFFAQVDEALVHLVRNAVDHGIESPRDRLAAGKPETGSVSMHVVVGNDDVEIVVSDDGAGIDGAAIAAKAVERGLISPDSAQVLAEEQKIQLVFESGLSTAHSVTEISGRGVGMFAARESIESLGGTISIGSSIGRGTSVRFRVPLRLD